MSCERYRTAILEGALGATVPAAAAAHLAGCTSCRQALERERELLLRIDADLRQTLAVEPSPALLPRIREHAGPERTHGSAWPIRWLLPAVAGGLVLFALTRLTPPSPNGPPREVAVARGRQPVAPAPEPTAGATTVGVAPSTERPEPHEKGSGPSLALVAARPPAEAEVLVPRGQEAALRRLVAVLRRGEVEVASVADLVPSPIEDLVLAPLDIRPLSPDSPE